MLSSSGSKSFDPQKVFLNKFFEAVNFEKKSVDDNKSMKNYRECKEYLFAFWVIFHAFVCMVCNYKKKLSHEQNVYLLG